MSTSSEGPIVVRGFEPNPTEHTVAIIWDAKKHGIRDDEIENKFSTSIGQFSRIPSVTKKNKVTVVGLLLLNFTTSEHAKQAQDRFHEEGAELLDGSDRILVYSFQHHSATYDFCEIDANGKFYLQVWFAKKNKPKKIFIIKGKVMDPTP